MKFLCLVVVALLGATRGDGDEDKAKALLKQINEDLAKNVNTFLELLWNYETNVTDETLKALQNGNAVFEYDDGDLSWDKFTDYDIKRQAQLFGIFKKSNTVPQETFQDLDDSIVAMTSAYFEQTVCNFVNKTDCNLDVDFDMKKIFETSSNAEELLYYWNAITDQLGPNVKPTFTKYVELGNAPSKMDGYPSKTEDWLSEFELPSEQIQKDFDETFQQLKPLYAELHAYVKNKLKGLYGKMIPDSGPIPIHLLGSLEGADWQPLYSKLEPYPGVGSGVDIDGSLVKKGFTPFKIFQTAEKFFTSLNLKPMTDKFWKKSLIEEPTDREVICDSSAWDFLKDDDFRINHCTEQTADSLYTAHLLMSYVENYILFADKPTIYKGDPVSGFGDGLSGALRRSAKSLKHLNKVGILDEVAAPNPKYDINYLFLLALYYVPYTSYALALDKFRWDVFSGKTDSSSYNAAYWKLRETYTGVASPVTRKEDGLDAATSSALVGDQPLIGDFTSNILQFQFLRYFCTIAGEFDPASPATKPLHNCDFSGSAEVGSKVNALMELGRSKPWYDVLKAGTGATKFDASGMVDFFAPLLNYLKEQNKASGVTVGW